MAAAAGKRISGWLKLLRPPNLLTVPGDPVSGFMLALAVDPGRSFVFLLPAACASLLLYAAGLVSNDVADREEDGRDRPERPIPSGSVSVGSAVVVSAILICSAIGLAGLAGLGPMLWATILAALVLSYNVVTKDIPLIGSINMGACRGVSLLLGASAAGWSPDRIDTPIVAAFGLILYIAAVTSLAARETESTPMPIRRFLPFAAVAICMVGLLVMTDSYRNIGFLVFAVASGLWPLVSGYRLGPEPAPSVLIPSIGHFIRGLLLIQAAFAAIHAPSGLVAAVLILLLWPLNAYMAARFYSS